MANTYYDTLGLASNASLDDIKKAYRRLMKRYHPDRFEAERARATTPTERKILERQMREAQQRAQQINQAYAVLSNTTKRREYDLSLRPQSSPTYRPTTNTRAYEYGRTTGDRNRARETQADAQARVNQQEATADFNTVGSRILFGLFVLFTLLFMCELTLNFMETSPQIQSRAMMTEASNSLQATLQSIGVSPNPAPGTLESTLRDGVESLYLEDYDRAIDHLTYAVLVEPQASTYFLRGVAFSRRADGVTSADNDRAISDFDRALQLNPDYAVAHFESGLIFYDRWRIFGDTDYRADAIRALQAYMDLVEDNRDARDILEQLGVRS
jgi:curved DNA-binding protein CbpA